MSEYDTANEHVLCFQIGKLKRRIADLSQALGLITTLKPTMVMDADHPLDMAKEVVEHVTARIAELEAENEKINYFFRRLRMFCIFAHWDNPNTEAEFYNVDAEIREYLSEYKVCIDQLTAHTDIERQDDNYSNHTQTQTIVYQKECEK